MEGLERVMEMAQQATSKVVGDLGTMEVCSIQDALLDRRRLNRIFDLLEIEYPDWPREASGSVEVGLTKEAGNNKKRKKKDY